MGTAECENHSFRRLFRGRRERTGQPIWSAALPVMEPYLRAIRFQGIGLLKRKENSSQGTRRRRRLQLRCREVSTSRFRNFNRIPFR